MGCALRISKIEENKDARCLRHVVLRNREEAYRNQINSFGYSQMESLELG